MVETDALEELDSKDAKRFREAIAGGKEFARSDSARKFVKSCEDFLKKTGHLTEKQMAALWNLDATSAYQYGDWDDPSYDEGDDFGGPQF